MDRQAIDTQMVYLQEHLVMPADDHELQWRVSKRLQRLSTGHQIILAKKSS